MENKRRQIEERKIFNEMDKIKVSEKSDYRCAWCGKKVYYGYEGTIDHFIPIKKGGTNDIENLVLMCKDCNTRKGSKIVPVYLGGKFLKPECAKELTEYVNNYMSSFDYVSRGNLMGYDMYEFVLTPEPLANAVNKINRKGKSFNIPFKTSKCLLRRAYPEDEPLLVDYWIRYLDKYKLLGSEYAAAQNIKFWLRFGVIYIVEKDNQICVMSTMLVSRKGFLSLDLYPFYSNSLAKVMARGIVTCVGEALVNENDLPFFPVSVNMLVADSLCAAIRSERAYIIDDRFLNSPYLITNDHYESISKESKKYKDGLKRLDKFLDSFNSEEKAIKDFIDSNNASNSCMWIAREMLTLDPFDPTNSDEEVELADGTVFTPKKEGD